MTLSLQRFSIVLFLFFSGFSFNSFAETNGPSWLDQSHRLFFPKSLGSVVSVQSDFPMLWWSFLEVDVPLVAADSVTAEPNWAGIQADCVEFSNVSRGLLERIFCGTVADFAIENDNGVGNSAGILEAWSRDYPLRHARPTESVLRAQMNDVLAKASLPIGPLVNLLRQDPFNSISELTKILESQTTLSFAQKGGVFYDSKTRRVLIPVQFAFPPFETQKMRTLTENLSKFCPVGNACYKPLFIGAHAATLENESQVKEDMHHVSQVSAVLLVILGGFILLTRRWRLFFIFPPILGAIFISALATIVVFGKIHGLTLAFGPGIVGLAMDYGLHIAFSNQPQRLWKANLFGLLTTVVVLLVMIKSEIPLLQQLMFFSSFGLVLGFLAIYFIFRKFPGAFSVVPYPIKVPRSAFFSFVILALVAASVIGFFKTELSLDMRQMGFETPKRAEVSRWFYESSGSPAPLFQVSAKGENPLVMAHAQKNWATQNEIRVSNVAGFLPPVETQVANLESWHNDLCIGSKWYETLPEVTRQFFSPFFKTSPCGPRHPETLESVKTAPAYVRDFGSDGRWLTMWLPNEGTDVEKIKAKYPEVISFVDMAMLFPKIFAGELRWMMPLSLGLAFLLLVFYYRRLSLALLGVTPFFSGLGLYLIMTFLFSWKTSFISVIGLIMVFGFSLDYGIFATDLMRRQKLRPDEGVWTALSVAGLVNVAGFLPLMVCHHPVLSSLGRTLFFGTIGTYLGSVWGIPGLYRFLDREPKS
jgi:hypothetical protein